MDKKFGKLIHMRFMRKQDRKQLQKFIRYRTINGKIANG